MRVSIPRSSPSTLRARETLSFGSVVRRIIVIPNSAALMDIGERFWCIVQPRFDGFRWLFSATFN